MEKTLTLREANQAFARVVREVESGAAYVITRNGKPVAKISPVAGARRVLTAEQEASLSRMIACMEEGWPLNASGFDRGSLHER